MKLKGNYSADVNYSVGDVVKHSDGVVYILQNPAAAGTSPADVHYWNRVEQEIADPVCLIMDALEITQAEIDKFFINDQTLLLKAGEGDDEKTYAITVDASGDSPELAVEEVTEEDDT